MVIYQRFTTISLTNGTESLIKQYINNALEYLNLKIGITFSSRENENYISISLDN